MDAHTENIFLRKRSSFKQPKWKMEEIRAGLEYFKELNGRYPSAREIDLFEYLPTARSIQRSLGGLESVRLQLGFDLSLTNLTKGTIRSEKAKKTYSNAVSFEESFYKYLIQQVPEVQVHEHKILRPGHICCDFFVYTSDKRGFAVDIFYAQDIFTLARTINIKFHRYKVLKCPVYFVIVGNNELDQNEIDLLMKNRKLTFPENLKVLTEKTFKGSLRDIINQK